MARKIDRSIDGTENIRVLTQVREAEGSSPASTHRGAHCFIDQPGEGDFRVAGDTGQIRIPAVTVVAPRAFQIELSHQRNVQIVAEDGNVHLREECPDVIRRRIDSHGLIEGKISETEGIVVAVVPLHVIRFINRANRRLDLTARNVEQRPIELGAFFIHSPAGRLGALVADIVDRRG